MRRLAVPAILALLMATTTTAQAGAGIPKIGSVQVGAYQVHLYNSSPGLRTGANTLTLEMPDLDPKSSVSLLLSGPAGERVRVPLRPLAVAGTHAEDGHGSKPDSQASPAKAPAPAAQGHGAGTNDGHGKTADDGHGKSTAGGDHGGDGHEEGAHGGAGFDLSAFLLRGTARLGATGDWTALLEITDSHGEKLSAALPLHAEQGGPNRVFVGFSGLLMGGAVLYGMVQRNRTTSKGGAR